jgi:hypothetical protein
MESMILCPVGEDVEVTIAGALGNVLSWWLTADGVIPSSDQKRGTPEQTREIIVGGNRGAGRGVHPVSTVTVRVA